MESCVGMNVELAFLHGIINDGKRTTKPGTHVLSKDRASVCATHLSYEAELVYRRAGKLEPTEVC